MVVPSPPGTPSGHRPCGRRRCPHTRGWVCAGVHARPQPRAPATLLPWLLPPHGEGRTSPLEATSDHAFPSVEHAPALRGPKLDRPRQCPGRTLWSAGAETLS